MLTKNSCIVPWRSVYVAPDGRVAVCCAYDKGVYGQKNKELFQEHEVLHEVRELFSQDAIPIGCRDCFKLEALGVQSRRQKAPQMYDKIGIDIETEKVHVQHLDISFGNVCNLKCRFCDPKNSTKLHAEYNALSAINRQVWPANNNLVIGENTLVLERLLNMPIQDVRFIEIKGGEPFLYKKHIEFLQILIERCNTSKTHLLYTTNGTIFDPRVFPYWRKFRAVSLIFSIDGTGSVYQYIRGGENFSLEQVTENILSYAQGEQLNFYLKFYFVVCVYNVLDIKNFILWARELKAKIKHPLNIHLELLTFPKPLSVFVLPLEKRLAIVEELKEFPEAEEICKSLRSEKGEGQSVEDFLYYTQQVDKYRKTNFRTEIPALANLLDS